MYQKMKHTLNVPHAYTDPSSRSTAEWLSPADACTIFDVAGRVTDPGKYSSPSSDEVVRPSAPSSLQPHVKSCNHETQIKSLTDWGKSVKPLPRNKFFLKKHGNLAIYLTILCAFLPVA